MKKLFEICKEYVQGIKRGDKKVSKDIMLILFLSGILIYVILLPTDNTSSYLMKKKEDTSKRQIVTQNAKDNLSDTTSYKRQLEQQLEDFLSNISGVGNVKVLLYLDTSEKYNVEKDKVTKKSVSDSKKNSDNEGTDKISQDEYSETTVYTVNSTGDKIPFVVQTDKPKVEGVIIAAQGAKDEKIRIQLIKSVMALFGVEANKVEVFTME